MKIGLLLLVLLLIQPTVAAPQLYHGPTVHAGFLKAGDYLNMGPDGERAYAMGLLDGFEYAPYFGAPENDKVLLRIATCTEGMRASQVAAIIEKYTKNHPEQWHFDLSGVGFDALADACHLQQFVPNPTDRHLTPDSTDKK